MKQEDTVAKLTGHTRQVILDELNMEICLRERLQETLESRIAWATCLQSSLGAVVEKESGENLKVDITAANPFQLAAVDALNLAEAPLLPILSREARFLTRPTPNVTPPPSATSSTNPYSRPYARHTRLRRSPSTIRTPPKFLYFRDNTTNAIARLLCPDCSRGDFPRVQSLLNHCRIQHGREFSSHDDCIRGCAVYVPADEEAWVIENGSELRHGGLPSLRRLFEIAVGSSGTSLEIASKNGTSTTQPNDNQEHSHISERGGPQVSTSLPTPASTHLSRTLGHHADSPALAPFLGRATKRRGIVVHDENTPVDIISGDRVDLRRQWNKPFIHRSRARPALDVEIPAEMPIPQYTLNVNPVAQGTRFHIVARVTISDRSLWIPIDQRPTSSPDHTHKWLLCIESPTYSLPLGAILDRASVICLSPGTTSPDGPLSGPPFVVSGTTAHPFLARVRLEWTSGSLNPPLEVDHWVELDALQVGAPVLGDEQVLDVELDRHTVFLPTAKHTEGSDPWNWDHGSTRVHAEPAPALPGYVVLLKSLVPKFPLTLRDTKSNVTAPLPYKRVSSPAHFRALITGRRKAVEWARARALCEAYEKLRHEKAPGEDFPRLSTGDVFSWLADTGFSLRQAVPRSRPSNATSSRRTSERITPSALDSDTFCAVCGGESVQCENGSWEGPITNGSSCRFSPMLRLPLLDVNPTVRTQSQHHPNDPVPSTSAEDGVLRSSIREILAATDPTLVFAVRCIITQFKLSCFPESESASVSGAGVLDPNGTAFASTYQSHWLRVQCSRLRCANSRDV